MENVTYILGAGFSAPLGLPVMRNFLIKSKDMYFSDPDKYEHFNHVFKVIGKMSVSKNYYDTDLFNIEEILSIVEMNDFVKNRRLRQEFARYICDVVNYYTPPMVPYPSELPGNWQDFIFGKEGPQKSFGNFVGSLLGLQFEERQVGEGGRLGRSFHVSRSKHFQTRYAVITLNYDLVLEQVCAFLLRQFQTVDDISFNKDDDPGEWLRPPLAKLHGSSDSGYVVPPTWAKGIHRKITPVWRNAHKILVESNHIRFIGYSLPISDAYIKYLLKSAVIHSKHLKSIDVICLDHDGTTKNRYDDFFKFGFYRFANANALNYVDEIYIGTDTSVRNKMVFLQNLEVAHSVFMNTPSMWQANAAQVASPRLYG